MNPFLRPGVIFLVSLFYIKPLSHVENKVVGAFKIVLRLLEYVCMPDMLLKL